MTGRMSHEEIEPYTRAARKEKLADTAIAKLNDEQLSVPLFQKWDLQNEKLNNIKVGISGWRSLGETATTRRTY